MTSLSTVSSGTPDIIMAAIRSWSLTTLVTCSPSSRGIPERFATYVPAKALPLASGASIPRISARYGVAGMACAQTLRYLRQSFLRKQGEDRLIGNQNRLSRRLFRGQAQFPSAWEAGVSRSIEQPRNR
jgi:hypothetical protein